MENKSTKIKLTKQHFIKVNTSWQPKNKLQQLLQEQIKKLDCTLWPCETLARQATVENHKEANAKYTGRCELLSMSSWENGDKSFSYGIESVFQVTVYPVKKYQRYPVENPEMHRGLPRNTDKFRNSQSKKP